MPPEKSKPTPLHKELSRVQIFSHAKKTTIISRLDKEYPKKD